MARAESNPGKVNVGVKCIGHGDQESIRYEEMEERGRRGSQPHDTYVAVSLSPVVHNSYTTFHMNRGKNSCSSPSPLSLFLLSIDFATGR
jgi:hypothetical protein